MIFFLYQFRSGYYRHFAFFPLSFPEFANCCKNLIIRNLIGKIRIRTFSQFLCQTIHVFGLLLVQNCCIMILKPSSQFCRIDNLFCFLLITSYNVCQNKRQLSFSLFRQSISPLSCVQRPLSSIF